MKKKTILFRADGNADIGAGHVMRCLSIGMAARDFGYDCKYIIADTSWLEVIEYHGFKACILNSDYSKMYDETNTVVELIKQYSPEMLFIDSYYVTEKYLLVLKRYVLTTYIDDLMSFAYPVDILINYNAFAQYLNYSEFYKKRKVPAPRLLLGEKYVPLRREFQNLSEVNVNKCISNILFSAGGADPERIALQFVQTVINRTDLSGYQFHIILGPFEPDADEIRKISRSYPKLYIHEKVSRMSELMQKCDLAISAAGSTLYELCSCGIPTITYILADNQIMGAESLSEKGILINAGDFRIKDNFFHDIAAMIVVLDHDYELRKRMHVSAISAVDGNGARNIINAVLEN